MKKTIFWLFSFAVLVGCVGGSPLPEVWLDETSGLMWQIQPPYNSMEREIASEYCDDLELGEHDNWRLPSIDELSTLSTACDETSGCPASATGCGAPEGLDWPFGYVFWSSSDGENENDSFERSWAWTARFNDDCAHVLEDTNAIRYGRCVR